LSLYRFRWILVVPLVVAAASCSGASGSRSVPVAGSGASPFAHRNVGPGIVVRSKFGLQIFGWAIDENGTDGMLTEAGNHVSYLETFDQTTGAITKVVAKQHSKTGDRELFADSIFANDVGLIDDENRYGAAGTDDTFDVMSPVTGEKLNGKWIPPQRRNFLIDDIADQQTNPLAAIAATHVVIVTQPPVFEVVVTDVATNTTKFVLDAPKGDAVNYPYLIAEDTNFNQAYVPSANYQSEPIFIIYDMTTGKESSFLGPYHEVVGMAVDSATHVMCSATSTDYNVEFYNLKTKKEIFSESLPGAGGEQEAGSSIAADPVNHLFLVEQPLSSQPGGGSTIYVFDEGGALIETLNGFHFGDESAIQVDAATRSGYVAGPQANELQSFSY
jgi:hypothetical protein